MTERSKALLAVAVAAVLVGSALLMPIVPGGVPSSGQGDQTPTATPQTGEVYDPSPASTADSRGEPSNLNAVPSSRIDELSDDRESGEAPPKPSDVRASAGTQTMEIETTAVDGEPALVLSDARTHDGRWVSVPTEWLEEVHGDVPSTVTIEHESGDVYSESVRVRGESAAFYVRGFSSNTVTFSGEVEVSGNPADDGSQYSYDLSDVDDTSDVSINMTGVANRQNETKTYSVTQSENKPLEVEGNVEPVAADGGDPVIEVVDVNGEETKTDSNNLDLIAGGGEETKTMSVPDGATVDNIASEIHFTSDNNVEWGFEMWVAKGNVGNDVFSQGSKIDSASGSLTTEYSPVLSGDPSWSTQPNEFTVGVRITDGESEFSSATYERLVTDLSVPVSYDIEGNDGSTASFSDASIGDTQPLNISQSTEELSFTGDGDATFEVRYQSGTLTEDSGVVLNGESVSVDGTLAEGESVQRTINKSAIEEGTNTVNVSVGDGSLSSDAPEPQVKFTLRHDATDRQAVEYTAEQWTSRYAVSKSYASDRANATLTIPFDDSDVVAMRNVEMRVNESGGWSSMSSANYALDGTTLTANLSDAYGGNIPAGSTVELRANASKIDPQNGSITIVEATDVGAELDTKIRVDSTDGSLRIATPDEEIHYAHNASYETDDYWVADQQGQRLHLPEARSSDELRVSTIPVRAAPEAGDAHITVENTSATEPAWSVREGLSGDDPVEYTFTNASDGTTYELWSTTHQIVRDSGTANSPLTLDDDDSRETLKFLIAGSSTSSSDGGDDEGGIGPISPQQSTDWAPLIAVALALGGLVVASRNSETVTNAGDGAADGVEGALAGVPVFGPALGSILAGLIQGAAQLARALVENRTIAVSLAGAVAWGAIQSGIIALPEGSTVIVLVAAISILSAVALRETGQWNVSVWVGVNAATAAAAAIVFSDADPVAAVANSDVLPLVAIGVLVLGYRAVQALRSAASTPDETNRVIVETDGGSSDD